MEKEIIAICIFTNTKNLVYEVGSWFNISQIISTQKERKITKIINEGNDFIIFSEEEIIAKIVNPISFSVEYK